jgi:integrase
VKRGDRMGQVKNQYYKDFLDGYLINEIEIKDIKMVMDNINHKHLEQARVLVIIAWVTGARPNEYLRLTPEHFSRSTDFLEIKFPGSKGSSARTISLSRYLTPEQAKNFGIPYSTNSKTENPFVAEIFDYYRKLFNTQFLFWFFRSDAIRDGVVKKIKKRDGTIVEKRYDKIYSQLSSKLNYYFPKWFDCLFPDGVPPYYLRHNRATKVHDKVGKGGTMETFGWKKEETMRKYTHKTKKKRKKIAEALME